MLEKTPLAERTPDMAPMKPPMHPRTRMLLEAPILPTLLKLAAPNVLVMLIQAGIGLVEAYFVGQLGTEALAGVSLVFPALMLMQMMSAGAMGGGISSAIARALGAGRRPDADALALHAIVISVGFGATFMVAMLLGGRALYAALGAEGATLAAALTYSNIIFAGIVLLWVFNALCNIIRGTGNMMTPSLVITVGALLVIPASPVLIFGWGPLPAFGVAGGGIAVVAYYFFGSLVLIAYLRRKGGAVRLPFATALRWPLFSDILRVGAVAAIVTLSTNLTVALTTGLIGSFGAAAIAGYGTGARLEYLLVPLVFGFGAPLVAMVGTNIGAGRLDRALRAAWIGAAIAGGITEAIGLAAAAFPLAWLSVFGTDPGMLDAGARYLRIVGPVYGLFGFGMALYFASQGAGRLLWPLAAGFVRFVIAVGGGYLALRATGDMNAVFVALAVALVAFGAINTAAVAGGAWKGRS